MSNLVAIPDVLALIDKAAAEPGSRDKVWLTEPSISRLKARILAMPTAVAPDPAPSATVLGLDAQGWHDTARRFHAGLQTIAHTSGAGIDHDWCRRQADYYLGRVQDGTAVWQMPGAPNLHHIVMPDPALAPPRRIEKAPVATIPQGETVTLDLNRPADANAG